MRKKKESHPFQAEINRLMSIIIGSMYSNNDIFLREVISNSADALDKIKYMVLKGKASNTGKPPYEIRIRPDADNNVIHIRDTGIGMTKEELINNLGRIAKSGTKDFLEKFKAGQEDIQQIGQFGVGFYSTFLIGDTVTVVSKHDEDEQYIWESSAQSDTSFTIIKDPRGNTLGRGTQLTIHVKEESKEYLDADKLKELILKYNEFISFPIYLWSKKGLRKKFPQTRLPRKKNLKRNLRIPLKM